MSSTSRALPRSLGFMASFSYWAGMPFSIRLPPLWLGSRGLSPDLTRPPHIYFSLAFGGRRSACDPSPSFLIFILFRGWMLPSRYFFCFLFRFPGTKVSNLPPLSSSPVSRFSRVFVRFGRRSLTTLPPQSFILFVYLLFYDVYVCFSFIYPCPLSNLKGSKILPCPLPAGAVPV